MAGDRERPPSRQTGFVELLVGVAAGLWLGSWVAFGAAWLIAYVVGTWLYPRRICPRCAKRKYRDDGRGNLRDRRCRRCGATGDVRRVAARVFGWGLRENERV